MRFRIEITGDTEEDYLQGLVQDIRNLTPESGGFTFQVGTHAEGYNDD